MNDKGIQDFLDHLRVERVASENTVAAYRADLIQFLRLLNRLRITSWELVTVDMIEVFLQELREEGRKDSTVARKLASIKSFFDFLAAEGVVADGLTDSIKNPQVGKSDPKTLTESELDRVLGILTTDYTREGRRNLLIVQLINATALRITELLSLDEANLIFDGEEAKIQLPDGTCHTLPTEMFHDCWMYIRNVRPRLKQKRGEKALLLSRRGGRLTRQGVWLLLKQLAEKSGLESNSLTPQTLRSTVAARHFANGESCKEVQEFLRLANSNSAERYRAKVAV